MSLTEINKEIKELGKFEAHVSDRANIRYWALIKERNYRKTYIGE